MNDHEMKIVLPGDDVTAHITQLQSKVLSSSNNPTCTNSKKKKPIKIGHGLQLISTHSSSSSSSPSSPSSLQTIKCTLAGRLIYNPSSHTIYVLTNTKRYTPQIHDRVITIIENQIGGDYYRVTIPNCIMNNNVILNKIHFEGATKRNRPYLANGDLVYGRIVNSLNYSSEIEISCLVNRGRDEIQKHNVDGRSAGDDGGASSKDWMTDEGTYGQLKNGTCIPISLGLAKELLNPNNVVLESLGKSGLKFEICIGANGYVWVNSERPEYTILILNAIKNSEVMTESQIRGMVKALVNTVRKSILDDEE